MTRVGIGLKLFAAMRTTMLFTGTLTYFQAARFRHVLPVEICPPGNGHASAMFRPGHSDRVYQGACYCVQKKGARNCRNLRTRVAGYINFKPLIGEEDEYLNRKLWQDYEE